MHDWAAIERFRKQYRIDPDRVRRMRHALYHAFEPVKDAVGRLGKDHGDRLLDEFTAEPLRIVESHHSRVDRSTKLVLADGDGGRIECVMLRAASGRMAVCVSTQVGCAAGCPFCATARMGLQRQLTAAEIVEQVLIAGRAARQEGRRLKNVVFMGMGEPLDNEASLHQALTTLMHPQASRFAPRRLLVSTVGIPAAMKRLVDQFPGIQVAVSLHSARPPLRARLIPWSKRHTWQELRDSLRYVAGHHSYHRHQSPLMVEHLMIDGVNDSAQDADALIEYLRGIVVHVNLIPYNPVGHISHWRPTPRERRDEFAQRLRAAGIFTTIRYSMGGDIHAACGQLANQ